MSGWQGKHGPYLIAEIGGNHEGDFDYAKHLTILACESGVDAVKFQVYTGDTLVNKIESPERNAHFKRFELSKEQYIELAELCHHMGVTFTASVWDFRAFDWIDPYMEFYKIGSGDLTAYPILRKVTSFGKPIILSTGLATLAEVKDSVNYIQSQDFRYRKPEYLALLQCTSMYPIPEEEANLRVMELFRKEFGLAVGYSDHTEGTVAVETAVAMGSQIIEMHFTDQREGKVFRDHKVSFTPDEICELRRKIDQIKRLQGKKVKEPTPSETQSGHVTAFRRAIYAAQTVEAGSFISPNNIIVLRPNVGMDARQYDAVLGSTTKKDLAPLERITWDMLQK